jgi:hypothetical protein
MPVVYVKRRLATFVVRHRPCGSTVPQLGRWAVARSTCTCGCFGPPLAGVTKNTCGGPSPTWIGPDMCGSCGSTVPPLGRWAVDGSTSTCGCSGPPLAGVTESTYGGLGPAWIDSDTYGVGPPLTGGSDDTWEPGTVPWGSDPRL